MPSLRLNGGEDAAQAFLAGLEMITIAASLGSFATLICRPATMTHAGMPVEAREEAGITPSLFFRLSLGLEAPEDVIADLERGLGGARKAAGQFGSRDVIHL
jgi:cystathionine beta-lyase/cystathionine gamma-synthase